MYPFGADDVMGVPRIDKVIGISPGFDTAFQERKAVLPYDNGIGIAPEDLPRVFEKGYTGYNGRIDRQASGIGLYLCRRICEKLSVGIRITSLVGKGTSVFLQLEQYEFHPE